MLPCLFLSDELPLNEDLKKKLESMKKNRKIEMRPIFFWEKIGMNGSLIIYQAWKTKTKATLG